MDDEKRKQLRLTAAMEGEEVIVARIGRQVSLSEMELICLVNFAEIGIMSLFSQLEGKNGDDAQRSLERHLDRIRKQFGQEGRDGLNNLSASTAALLRGRKFSRYVA